MNIPLIVQVVGTTLIAMSLLLVAIPLGLAFAGLSLVAFGIAAERN
jgi:uncharacterized membrane protein